MNKNIKKCLMRTGWYCIICFMVTVLPGKDLYTQEKIKIAVLDFVSDKEQIRDALTIQEAIISQLSEKYPQLLIIEPDDVIEPDQNLNISIDQCFDMECVCEAGKILRIRKLIAGKLTQEKDDLVLIIKVIDSVDKTIDMGYKIKKKNSDEFMDLIETLSRKIGDKIINYYKEKGHLSEKEDESDAEEVIEEDKSRGKRSAESYDEFDKKKYDQEVYFAYDGISENSEVNNYIIDDISDPYKNSKIKESAAIYDFSYYYYFIRPVYSFPDVSYFLYNLLSRPNFLSFQISTMPDAEGENKYSNSPPGDYPYNSTSKYNSESIYYYLGFKVFLLNFTQIIGLLYSILK